MRVFKLPSVVSVVAAALAVSLTAHVEARSRSAFANIRIDNFGQVDSNYYRGAQPMGQDYVDLSSAGIRVVVDLTKDGRQDEADLVKQAGMQFHRIPLTTSEAPSQEAVADFLQLVTDRNNQPVYVHCQGGRHRTGVMTAIYRMKQDGWTADQAYQEMKQYRFEGFPPHPELKRFVFDYYAQLVRPSALVSR